MHFIRRILMYVVCLPSDLVGWTALLFVRIVAGKQLVWKRGVLFCELDDLSILYNKFYRGWGGTTVAPHGVMVGPGELEHAHIIEHELVHGEQYECAAFQDGVAAAILMACHHPLIGLAWSAFGGLFDMFSGFLVAAIRGDSAYRGSVYERAAFDITEVEHEG